MTEGAGGGLLRIEATHTSLKRHSDGVHCALACSVRGLPAALSQTAL